MTNNEVSQNPNPPKEPAVANPVRTLTRRDFVRIASVAASAAAVGVSHNLVAAPPKSKMSTPTIFCVGDTLHTIFLQVCAGATGAPAGFSIQWQPLPDGVACGDFIWPESDDPGLCKASFSGSPGCSVYNLAPNTCITVEIGNLLDSECGVGLDNCGADELDCDTVYVFRSFAHANNKLMRSAFTPNVCCSTEPCTPACVRTQGYWKTHACNWPAPFVPGTPDPTDSNLNGVPDNLEGQCAVSGNSPNSQCPCDAAHSILIGSNAYNQCQLLCALATPAQGNALLILAHQLIAAKLNILSGATAPVDCDIAAADALIGSRNILSDVVPPGGPGNVLGPAMTAAAACLDLYNNGDGGVLHCP